MEGPRVPYGHENARTHFKKSDINLMITPSWTRYLRISWSGKLPNINEVQSFLSQQCLIIALFTFIILLLSISRKRHYFSSAQVGGIMFRNFRKNVSQFQKEKENSLFTLQRRRVFARRPQYNQWGSEKSSVAGIGISSGTEARTASPDVGQLPAQRKVIHISVKLSTSGMSVSYQLSEKLSTSGMKLSTSYPHRRTPPTRSMPAMVCPKNPPIFFYQAPFHRQPDRPPNFFYQNIFHYIPTTPPQSVIFF